ncbi:cytosine permease, partial [Escherichia coli]|uniref:cytosine permease n=2 Tax=Escherichia coli TaxID=562 RepID=UPI002023B335
MEHQRKLFQQRGYSEDLLPKTQSQRTWKTFNYFTLWMGSVHNVPNYVMVGGFFILGLSTFSIMLAIILSAFFGNDSNLLIVFYVQIMPDDFVMQLHR